MERIKVLCVVGARPNFMKSAPLMREFQKRHSRFNAKLIHTGQHYDRQLCQLFFEDLKMPQPDAYLGVGSGSHAQQTAKIMVELERILQDENPKVVIVFGDVNSTMAAAIVAAKLHLKIAHVEAGLRSFDNTMPEEINRIVTDRLSDFLFVTEKSGLEHLRQEGTGEDKIFFTGNIMIDSLVSNLPVADKSKILEKMSLTAGEYVVLTLHRPANVDNMKILSDILNTLSEIGQKIPVVFPCHPRTKKNLEQFGLRDKLDLRTLHIIEPLGYLDFLKLQSQSKFVLTDSGGVQEETTYLNIPCITLRDNTERPVTVDVGSNVVTGLDRSKIMKVVDQIFEGNPKKGKIPDLWDGQTAGRIVDVLERKLSV